MLNATPSHIGFFVRQIDDGIGLSFVAPGHEPKDVNGDKFDVMFDRENI